MASRSKRHDTRKKRRRRAEPEAAAFDPHARVIVDSWTSVLELMERFTAAEDPEAALDAAFDDAITRFVVKARRFDALRLIEVGRLAFLPMAPEGAIRVDTEASAARLDLLALVALAAQLDTETPGTRDRDALADQEMSQFVSEAKEELDALLRLARMRAFAAIDSNDKLAMVSLLIQGAEVHMRNSSYPEVVAVTNRALLDGEPNVHAALIAELGFDANDALAVLEACHDLQLRHMNERMDAMRTALSDAMEATEAGQTDDGLTELARSGFMSMFEPAADEVTVAVGDIVAHTGIAEERVHAVVECFRLDLGTASPAEVVHAFTTGKNPMRVRPLVVAGNGRIMLAHSALNVCSVRENLEEHLKTSIAWNSYAKHRGDLLETRFPMGTSGTHSSTTCPRTTLKRRMPIPRDTPSASKATTFSSSTTSRSLWKTRP
ncbi:hypothetical protein [Embleya sp. NPDC059259]|uniref:hypothetical protein n=1 Tax=Embleya sp. NPDC059259 TaxID=3346796 RepID=UPI00367577E6